MIEVLRRSIIKHVPYIIKGGVAPSYGSGPTKIVVYVPAGIGMTAARDVALALKKDNVSVSIPIVIKEYLSTESSPS